MTISVKRKGSKMKNCFTEFSCEKEPLKFFTTTLLFLVALVVMPLMALSIYFNQSAEEFYRDTMLREGQNSFLRYSTSLDSRIGEMKRALEFLSTQDPIDSSFPEMQASYPLFISYKVLSKDEISRNQLLMSAIYQKDDRIYLSSPMKGKESVLEVEIAKELLFLPASDARFANFAVLSLDNDVIFTKQRMPFLTSRRFLGKLYMSNGTFDFEDEEGNRWIIMNYFSPNSGWVYVGSTSVPYFYSSYKNLSDILFKISILTLLFSFLIAIYVALKLSGPPRKILKYIREGEEGSQMRGIYGTIQKTLLDQNERIRELRPMAINEFYRSILTEKKEKSQRETEYFSVFEKNLFTLISFNIENSQEEVDKKLLCLGKAEDMAKDYFGKRGIMTLAVHMSAEESVVIVNSHLSAEDKKAIETWSGHEDGMTIAISSSYEDIAELDIAYSENREKLRQLAYDMGNESIEIDGKLQHMLINTVKTGNREDLDSVFKLYDAQIRTKSRSEILEISNMLIAESLNCLLGNGLTFDGNATIEENEKITKEEISVRFKETITAMLGIMESEHSKNSFLIMEQIRKFIEENLQQNIGLQEVANHISLSPSYTGRLIKENFNMGIVEYISTLRIDRAKNLLKYTDATVEKIGYQVGFSNVRSFLRTFKQYTSMTPGQWRSNET